MLHVLRGSGGAGGLDTDHLLIPAVGTGAGTRGCDGWCAGRGARRGLGGRPGHVLGTRGGIYVVGEGKKKKKKTCFNYHVDPEKMRRPVSHNNLLWCRWSRDCRTAAQPASAAPAAGERGPEGTAGDSGAPAASSPRRRGDLRSPALSDWTSGAAAP